MVQPLEKWEHFSESVEVRALFFLEPFSLVFGTHFSLVFWNPFSLAFWDPFLTSFLGPIFLFVGTRESGNLTCALLYLVSLYNIRVMIVREFQISIQRLSGA